uniref:DPH-type MB domain-containing protein n=1 Tax=Oryza punctata TaxID=4537 RepID=A0A0E0LVW0_ORYPU
MPLSSNISTQKTHYEVLSVNEGATYDEVRAGYRAAILNVHPDKSQAKLDSLVSSVEHGEFFSVQKAWEVLRDPKSRAEYDKQLQTSRQNSASIGYEIEIEEMTVESTGDAMELMYPCRCGDHFSISSSDLEEMGILVDDDGEICFQSSDCVSASVVLSCGSCSLKTRLVIIRTS